MAVKKEVTETEAKVELTTTEAFANTIFEKVKEGKIEFGEFSRNETDTEISKECNSKPLPSGGIIGLVYKHQKGQNDNGRSYNPKYSAFIQHNSIKQPLRGKSVRMIFDRVMNNTGIELTKENIQLCNDALAGL